MGGKEMGGEGGGSAEPGHLGPRLVDPGLWT